MSSRTNPTLSLESVPNELQEKSKDDVTQDWNHHAHQATCRKPSGTKPIPSLESFPNELQEKCHDVDTQHILASKEEKHHTFEVDTESVLTAQEEPSNKIDDLTSQERHHPLAVSPENELATKGESLNKSDDLSQADKHRIIGVVEATMLARLPTPGEPLNKIDETASQKEKHQTLDVDPETMLATHGGVSNLIDDDLTTKDPVLVDLNDLQLEQAPPGFSEKRRVEVSSIMTKQSVEHPRDTLLGSKVENSSRGRPILEGQVGSIERETEQPQSEFCFPSPLWSDPCLEFAFKTLTGAIPFDDNLAIQDYIQHQLRTSEETNDNQRLPDTCVRSDETKIVPQFPEDAKFSNSNGLISPEIKQVKKK